MTTERWQYYVKSWDLPAGQGQMPGECGLELRLHMIVDAAGEVCGMVGLLPMRRRRALHVRQWLMYPHVNWYAAAPGVLRGLVALAVEPEPLHELSLELGRTHPAYDVLGEQLAASGEPPYAWYVRVADVPGFVRHIAPVLEERLARSPLAGFSGEYKIDLYRGGLRLEFAGGRLAVAEPWREVQYGYEGKAALPPLVFLQLLFGHRSLAELKAIYPDVYTEPHSPPLLEILFPQQASFVWSASYT
jgi:hypothetical protein